MSVLQLLGSAEDGGAETYFLALVEALAQDGLAQACAIRAHAGRQARSRRLVFRPACCPSAGRWTSSRAAP